MSSFTEPLILRFLDTEKDLKRFEVFSSFTYFIDELSGNMKVVVPPGFRTDFASTPRISWLMVPPIGLYGKAACVHDYLCEHKTAMKKNGLGEWEVYAVTRKEADRIFREAMKVLGVGKAKRNIMYWGVRLYSILTFKK